MQPRSLMNAGLKFRKTHFSGFWGCPCAVGGDCIVFELLIHTAQKTYSTIVTLCRITVDRAHDGTCFYFIFLWRGSCTKMLWQFPLRELRLKLKGKASKLFLSPQQGFCCYMAENSTARRCTGASRGGRLQHCACLSEAISSPPALRVVFTPTKWINYPVTDTHPHHSHTINSAWHMTRGLDDLGTASSVVKIDLNAYPLSLLQK